MTLIKVVDGVEIPLSEAEIAERLAEEAAWEAGSIARQNAELEILRQVQYTKRSDGLGFKYLRTGLPEDKAAWEAERALIQTELPYVVEPV